MNFKDFLRTKTAAGAILKVMVPARNYSRMGYSYDFQLEPNLHGLYVFDFQITAHNCTAGYDVIIWLSKDKPIF